MQEAAGRDLPVSPSAGQISLCSPNVACRDLVALSQVILQRLGSCAEWKVLLVRVDPSRLGRYGEFRTAPPHQPNHGQKKPAGLNGAPKSPAGWTSTGMET